MKKILIICPFFPYPLISGGHQAFFISIDVMRHDFDIHLLFIEDKTSKANQQILKALWPEVKFYSFITSKRKFKNREEVLIRLGNRIRDFFIYRSKFELEFSSCMYLNREDYLDFINNIITKNSIDIVQTEFITCLSLVAALPKSVKTVFVHHEIRFSRHELFLKEHNLTNSSYYKYKFNCLKCEELALLSLYDAIITLSDIDLHKLKNESIPEQKLYSSFATIRQKNETNELNHFNGYLTFIGPEYHQPNVIGLDWFLNNCWPTIIKKNEQLHLKIIGKWNAKKQKHWCSKYKNIEFLGFVENLYEALSGSIMIVPITIGSGIRMKILEATMMKIPFVTTEIGVEGLPFKDSEDCFVCNDAIDFANKILILKEDFALQQQFVMSANYKIKSLFSPEKLKESRSFVYDNIFLT